MTVARGKGVSPQEVAGRYPYLYHMAEAGTWESIRKNGLLSTSALLDLYRFVGAAREAIECRHRPGSVTISNPPLPDAVIRDQRPMSDKRLRTCLSGASPAQWYKLLNGKVFFWTTEPRFVTLLKAYSGRRHLMLTIDTASLLSCETHDVTLCPMNSGATRPYAHPRSPATFQPIETAPFHERRKRGLEPVAEVCVEHSVRDIAKHTTRADHVVLHGDTFRVLERIV